jgi:hypothetical protein
LTIDVRVETESLDAVEIVYRGTATIPRSTISGNRTNDQYSFRSGGINTARCAVLRAPSKRQYDRQAVRLVEAGGWVAGCRLAGSGLSNNPLSAEFPDECWGDPVRPGQPGYSLSHKVFHFNCHTQYWDASGTVAVP